MRRERPDEEAATDHCDHGASRKPGGRMSDLVTVTYRPTEDEPYMSKNQQEYFRRKLVSWREEILRGSN